MYDDCWRASASIHLQFCLIRTQRVQCAEHRVLTQQSGLRQYDARRAMLRGDGHVRFLREP
jgi:hypothetical protein